MKKLYFASVCVLGLLLASCASAPRGIYRVSSTNRVMNTIGGNIIVNDIYADLDVRPAKMTYVYETSFDKSEMVKESAVLDNAIYEALIKANADVMVSPIFKIEYEEDSRGKYYTITVVGYPADYKKFTQEKTPMERTGYELKELKKDASYLVVDKDQNGSTTGYTIISSTGEIGHSAPNKCKPAPAPVAAPKDKEPVALPIPFKKK